MALDIGQWIGLSSFVMSAALAFNGHRSTRIAELRQKIEDLEQELRETKMSNENCEADLRRLRRDNEWLMSQLRKEGKP